MSIFVIDQGPELFWFVSNALVEDDIPLKHIQTIEAGEQKILEELPTIVILNGDDKDLNPEKFISKMRNHVFARNTMFIVFTSDTNDQFKKTLLIAGAAQILYRGNGFGPSPKFFFSIVKWCMSFKNSRPDLFDSLPYPFKAEAELTSYGRLGWISANHCLVETNLDINPGELIKFRNSVFKELKIKNMELKCIEKNMTGRYYQYSNSLLCEILSPNPIKDSSKIDTWIKNNLNISKDKLIKLVYFENDPVHRETIRQMIKTEKRYCARGFNSLQELPDILSNQLPQLIIINRAMIQTNKTKFEKIKEFINGHFCYCITYDTSGLFNATDFKSLYSFAMHLPSIIDLPLLELMIQKLEAKLPETLPIEENRIYFNKHSVHSRISFHTKVQLTELAITGAGIEMPFGIGLFGACEITSASFGKIGINQTQYFRVLSSQSHPPSNSHKLIFMGQTIRDNKLVKVALETIASIGFERWIDDDFSI